MKYKLSDVIKVESIDSRPSNEIKVIEKFLDEKTDNKSGTVYFGIGKFYKLSQLSTRFNSQFLGDDPANIGLLQNNEQILELFLDPNLLEDEFIIKLK